MERKEKRVGAWGGREGELAPKAEGDRHPVSSNILAFTHNGYTWLHQSNIFI